MFIDTDTTADVRNIVANSLRRKVNGLNSDIAAFNQGQTSIVPKSQLRRKAIELTSYIDVYFEVFHWSEAEGFDPTLIDAANQARSTVAALYGKTKL